MDVPGSGVAVTPRSSHADGTVPARKPGVARPCDDVPSIIVRRLPYDDPGTPDLRSPGRFLLWTGAQQWPPCCSASCYGVIWMVAQALVPAAIGRGLQTGVADGDLAAAGRWSLRGARAGHGAGGVRHPPAPDGGDELAGASFRAMQLLGRHSALRRRGDPPPAAHRRGRRGGHQRRPAHRRRVRRLRPLRRRDRLVRRRRGAAAAHVRPARAGRAARRTRDGAAARPAAAAPAAAAAVQREVAGKLTALGADTVAGLRVLRGIGGEPAFLRRYRARSAASCEQPGSHVAARRPPWTPPRCCCRASSWSSSPGSAPGWRSRARSTSATWSRSTATPSSWSSRSVRRSRRPTR